jgi:hypothetical protein
MKLKIYILKKKQLIWTAVILTLLIVSAILIISIRTTQTINFLTLPNSFKADINNDGKIDTVIAKIDDATKKYSINVICSDDNGYILEPDPVIKCFGNSDGKVPINITFKDINNDGKEEIFIQSSDDRGPILHIFKYGLNGIERIASGRYSMYGVVNNPTSNETMLVLLSDQNNKIKLTYFNSDADTLTPCSSKFSLNLGANVISSVVNFIEKKDVETVSLNIDKKMESKLVKGTLIDGIISDVKFVNYDYPSQCTYTLRTSTMDNSKPVFTDYKILLSLNDNSSTNPSYSISDIQKLN